MCAMPDGKDASKSTGSSQKRPAVVTPPAALSTDATTKRCKLQSTEPSNGPQRNLFDVKEREESSQQDDHTQTQSFPYSHHSQAEQEFDDDIPRIFVHRGLNEPAVQLVPTEEQGTRLVFSVGRNPSSSLPCAHPFVSWDHARLIHDQRDSSFSIQATKKCFIRDDSASKWIIVPAGTERCIHDTQTVRLLPNAPSCENNSCLGQFTLVPVLQRPGVNRVGSASMDFEYQKLLRALKCHGQHQSNKKGGNTTLREMFTMSINLRSKDFQISLLPVTTLRKIFAVSAVLEAIWYLRGEDHVQFLQRHQQRFWDRQAHKDTAWVGFSYGLLANYSDINPLEENVIQPLAAGKTSRNMVCTLTKHGEPTVQQACTSSIQFAVAQNEQNEEELNLTVTQRSSDVILGLPHDVIVWSIILHLVRREVSLRTHGMRKLRAGTLQFCISAGGAHYYDINAESFEELLDRKPVLDVNPSLVVDASCEHQDIFTLAKQYDDKEETCPNGIPKLRVRDYTRSNPRMNVAQATE
jgi:thymidylate synthase